MSRGHGKFKEVRQKYYSAVVAAAGHVASVEDMATWTNSLFPLTMIHQHPCQQKQWQ